ncbi:MAG: hypothetical protein U0840_07565 [Gemmataceae bacterium]
MRAKRLTLKERKEIFFSIVRLEDQGPRSHASARGQVAADYGIDENQVEQIVDEGIDKDWLDSELPSEAGDVEKTVTA